MLLEVGRGERWVARRPVVVALCAILGLVGCSSEGTGSSAEPSPVEATSKPSEGGTAASSLNESCEVLNETELSELSGQQLPEPKAGQTGGLPTCQWGTPGQVGVQVVSVPAGAWADQLPALVEQLQASGLLTDPESRRKLEAARRLLKSDKAIDPDRACDLFGLMLEIQGQPGTSTRTVNLIPTKADPQAISGQSCSRGRYTSVLLVAPGLNGSGDEITRVSNALTKAHERGIN